MRVVIISRQCNYYDSQQSVDSSSLISYATTIAPRRIFLRHFQFLCENITESRSRQNTAKEPLSPCPHNIVKTIEILLSNPYGVIWRIFLTCPLSLCGHPTLKGTTLPMSPQRCEDNWNTSLKSLSRAFQWCINFYIWTITKEVKIL